MYKKFRLRIDCDLQVLRAWNEFLNHNGDIQPPYNGINDILSEYSATVVSIKQYDNLTYTYNSRYIIFNTRTGYIDFMLRWGYV